MLCKPHSCLWGRYKIPQRYLLVILLHLAIQNSYNLRVVLNVAIVEMVEPVVENGIAQPYCTNYGVLTPEISGGKFPWPRNTEAMILYAFFVGSFISHVPGGLIADRYGGRWVLGICMFTSTIVTLVFPLSTQHGGHVVAIALRFILGLAQGPVLPCIASFVSTWIPSFERTLLGAIAYSGSNLGTVLGNIFTGVIIKQCGNWPSAFYFWGGLCVIYLLLHLLYLFSSPQSHPFITPEELDYLNKFASKKRILKIPWAQLFTNMPFWANCAGQIGHNYIYFTMVTYLPTYMKEILAFEIQSNAFFSALPFLVLWLCSLGLSFLAKWAVDDRKMCRRGAFNNIFATLSNMGSAGCILAAVYVGCSRTGAIGFYLLSMIFKSFYYFTITVNTNQLSRNFGGIIFGVTNGLSSLAGVVGNALIGAITKDRKLSQWQSAFWITLGVAIMTSIIFVLFSSAERQDFDYAEDEEHEIESPTNL
ncbi:putative inorganic phosphate cotransporter isoform X2 [Cylas formicarius]|uniref:putative inorganic phosphate cotransporter isoform X2 n=1 Tax=Cylas formicarius TaxID=197179 RepID=UPI00295851E1|nr:putative inorganic phosphate cotransporter isoform X2 [Cylas formicarius]